MAKPAARKATGKKTRVSAPRTAPASTAAEPEAPRKLTRAQLIDELNKDLAKEYAALIQYVQHA
ncbi:MAG: hypothetical protein WCP98_08850, partial [Actinomycetes bacterium]